MLYNSPKEIKLTHYNINRDNFTYPVIHHNSNLVSSKDIFNITSYYDVTEYQFTSCAFFSSYISSNFVTFNKCIFINTPIPIDNKSNRFIMDISYNVLPITNNLVENAIIFISFDESNLLFNSCNFQLPFILRDGSVIFSAINSTAQFINCTLTLVYSSSAAITYLSERVDISNSKFYGVVIINSFSAVNLISTFIPTMVINCGYNIYLNLLNEDTLIDTITFEPEYNETLERTITSINQMGHINKIIIPEFHSSYSDIYVLTGFKIDTLIIEINNIVTLIDCEILEVIAQCKVESHMKNYVDLNGNPIKTEYEDNMATLQQPLISGINNYEIEIKTRIIVSSETIIV